MGLFIFTSLLVWSHCSCMTLTIRVCVWGNMWVCVGVKECEKHGYGQVWHPMPELYIIQVFNGTGIRPVRRCMAHWHTKLIIPPNSSWMIQTRRHINLILSVTSSMNVLHIAWCRGWALCTATRTTKLIILPTITQCWDESRSNAEHLQRTSSTKVLQRKTLRIFSGPNSTLFRTM